MPKGRLLYLIGASGVGKDTLMGYARENLPADEPVAFAHRYITRPADAGGENHVALTIEAFQLRQRHGCFAMAWQSHGLHYGIGIEIRHWLRHGLDVVVNGSRAYLDQADTDFSSLLPVLLRVKPETLRCRLEGRGREASKMIEQRIERNATIEAGLDHPAMVRIDNDGEVAVAGDRLVAIIRGDAR